jgi:hypothetical protein
MLRPPPLVKLPLPVGLVNDARDRVVLDPDQQVQDSLRTFFQTFQRVGTASATVKFFQQETLLFPRRLRRGVRKDELVWGPLEHSRALQTLHTAAASSGGGNADKENGPSRRNDLVAKPLGSRGRFSLRLGPMLLVQLLRSHPQSPCNASPRNVMIAVAPTSERPRRADLCGRF